MKYFSFILTFLLAINTFSFAGEKVRPNKSKTPTIGIMGVDTVEIGNLLSFMENPQKSTKGMREAYSGKLWGLPTVIFISHEEKAAASSAVVEMAIDHHVDAIIFIGTAGALDPRLNIGDIVIPKHLINYDVDYRPYAPLFETPGLGKEVKTTKFLRKAAIKAANDFLQNDIATQISPEVLSEMHIQTPKVVEDTVGSADSFLVSEKMLHNLQNAAPDVTSVEMEGAAAAQTAADYRIPFVLIRTVANYVESPLPDQNHRVALDYWTFLKKVQWVYSDNIMKRLFVEIKDQWKKRKKKEYYKTKAECGIICRSNAEARNLAEAFEGSKFFIKEASRTYYIVNLEGPRVVIVGSGFGKAAAAAATTHMIVHYNVKRVIDISAAAKADSSLQNGDIVLSDSLIQHDVDVRPFRPPFELSTISVSRFPTDTSLRTSLLESISQILPNKRVNTGVMATGDSLVADTSELKKLLPELLVTDFGAASSAQIAYQYGIPFVSLKIVGESNLNPMDESQTKDLRALLYNYFNQHPPTPIWK